MRKSIVAGVAVTSAAAFALIGPGQASADTSATTDVTFTIASGSLAITAPEAVDLPVDSAVTQATATFSKIEVTDNRRGSADWSVYVDGGGFTLEDDESGLPSIYAPGEVTKTGTATVVPSAPFTLTGDADQDSDVAVAATGVQGTNTASWTPTVTVTLPLEALAGTYSSTITHSVS